jgi:hypothetical protein
VNQALYFFLFYMKLSQFHDLNYEFDKITQVNIFSNFSLQHLID